MSKIVYDGQSYECRKGETVLECLTTHGVPIASGCQAGACQTCLMRAVKGSVGALAQVGLKPTLAAQGYFLTCICRPAADIEVAPGNHPGDRMAATVLDISSLNRDIVRVRLCPEREFDYRPGQFLRLFRSATISRCYSLASVPDLDKHLELHVRRIPSGAVSTWVHEELRSGDVVDISDSMGTSFYLIDRPERGLCLIATGSGLAPLYGIARDALRQGHQGPVWLYHGSHDVQGLYLTDELQSLCAQHANFRYVPCISGAPPTAGYTSGRVHEVALAQLPDLGEWSVHLCGHPEMVKSARKCAYLAGASLRDIHADPFLPSGVVSTRMPVRKRLESASRDFAEN
jgi:ferredoxin-NADP reductase/ferredoxin